MSTHGLLPHPQLEKLPWHSRLSLRQQQQQVAAAGSRAARRRYMAIREGAIDTLLKIWKDELPRMGGYVTNHGQLVLHRAQIILDGLARREDDIFRRRRECKQN